MTKEKILTKNFCFAFLSLLSSSMVMYMLMATITQYATEFGTTAAVAGLVSGIYVVGGYIYDSFGGFCLQRHGLSGRPCWGRWSRPRGGQISADIPTRSRFALSVTAAPCHLSQRERKVSCENLYGCKKASRKGGFSLIDSSSLRTAINASVGNCTVPKVRIFFLPFPSRRQPSGGPRLYVCSAEVNSAAPRFSLVGKRLWVQKHDLPLAGPEGKKIIRPV